MKHATWDIVVRKQGPLTDKEFWRATGRRLSPGKT